MKPIIDTVSDKSWNVHLVGNDVLLDDGTICHKISLNTLARDYVTGHRMVIVYGTLLQAHIYPDAVVAIWKRVSKLLGGKV